MPLNAPYKLAPEQIKDMFLWSEGLYRILADKSLKALSTVNGGNLVALVHNERILAKDISWCLEHGNWPKYTLLQIDGDPFNVDIENLIPMRTKSYRFRTDVNCGLFVHPYHQSGFKTKELARQNWGKHVKARCQQDLDHVLKQEREEREARRTAIKEVKYEVRKVERKTREVVKGQVGIPLSAPSRPKPIPGRAWHYYEKEWLSVPESCHVADDYRRRCYLVKHQGAVRFVFQPEYGIVFAYDADDKVIVPDTRKF